MSDYETVASMIRAEIAKVKVQAERCGWTPGHMGWHRAFGEITGMYRILSLVDPEPWKPQGNPDEIMQSLSIQ